MKSGISAVCAATAIAGLFAAEATAQAPQRRDMLLEQSGFIMRPADTPQKVKRLKRLPPLQFLARNSPHGRYYLFADPKLCICVFLGSEQAMSNYKSQLVNVPESELAPTQKAPRTAARRGFVRIQELSEEIFGHPVDGDILEYRY